VKHFAASTPLLAATLLAAACGSDASSRSAGAVATGLAAATTVNDSATCAETGSGTYDCILGPSLLKASVTCDTERCAYAYTIPARAGDKPCGLYTASDCAAPEQDVSGSYPTP
jgi:hypothetical protein